MAALAKTSWLTQVLRLLPPRTTAMLDAWSHRIALRRQEKRRLAGRSPPVR